ncbi:DUF4229 domain-containing protein [Actinomadura atramentaria]|uniref:DUF4229 domain-containing protein n=1 Tax=Actinomadura atramentaria TaxID=1990 RepID=UPI000476DC3D|nr:DUF4229 domain-containing protein [Actinomadura atramentaria]
MRPVMLYTLARFGIFLATAGVLALCGARGILLLLLALLISGVISFVLLSGQRDRMSSVVESGLGRQRAKLNASRTKEDA